MSTSAKQVGRLHDPTLDLRTDPRTDRRLLAALAPYGLDVHAAPPPLGRTAPAHERIAYVGQAHAGFEALYAAIPNELPGDDAPITRSTETVRGVDGNDITLHISRPTAAAGSSAQRLPGLVYIHGGGMTLLNTINKVHSRWCHDLALAGMVVIAVDFRNAHTAEKQNPFPAGLDDCSSALAWIDAHRQQLGISRIVLQGESGGANLCIATALKAKRDGRLASIDGVYVMVPYISGGYGWSEARRLAELPSLVENDSYFLNGQGMELLAGAYDEGTNAENPLCWPYFATEADLAGLPPHVVVVNELDPLRDEGLAYFRKLQHAGVRVAGRMNLGLTHAADLIFRQAVIDVYRTNVSDVKRFADSL